MTQKFEADREMTVGELLEFAHLDGLTRDQLVEKVKRTKDDLEDDISNAMHMIAACTARLTALHLTSASTDGRRGIRIRSGDPGGNKSHSHLPGGVAGD
jgi:hypothetical protein